MLQMRTCRRSVRLVDEAVRADVMLRCHLHLRSHMRLCCTVVESMVAFEIPFFFEVDIF